MFSTSAEKKERALGLGAVDFIDSTDLDAVKAAKLRFHFILSTIPESHDINPYIPCLRYDGTITVVGNLGPFSKPTINMEVANYRRSVAGSLIGGIKETQKMLDCCGQLDITTDVKIIDNQGR